MLNSISMFRKLCLVGLLATLNTIMLQAQHVYTFYSSANTPLPDNTIRCLTPQGDSTLWIGTDWGLVKHTPGGWEIFQQSNSPISDNYIRSIAIDDSNKVWIGTANGGVNVLSDTGWHNYSTGNSPLPNDHIKAIAFDTSGHPWFGTIGGVATIQDTGWTLFNMSNAPFDVDNTGCIYIADDNTKWLGTVNGGLLRYQNGIWTKFRNNNSTLPDNTILNIAPDSSGNLWMAMPAGGMAYYDGSFEIFNTQNSSITSNTFRWIAIDSSGTLFLASGDKGIVSFTGGSNWASYNSFANPDTNLAYLNTNELLSIAVDAQNNIWAGTNGNGLVKMQFVEQDTIVDGLSGYNVANVKFYPNPVQSDLIIEGLKDVFRVSIYNATGQLLRTSYTDGVEIKLPFDNQPKGNYYVVLQNKTQRIVLPITKQ